MPVPQLQWELTRTSNSTLSVAHGIIRAATSDNIQILALLACERFGATLAICPETRRKAEYQVIKMQTPVTRVITFLNATVGYSPGDCASHLAQSLAGIQFIGLAAALIPSYSVFEGAMALEVMLRSSARDITLLPPARHLKDLLMSLEHRCVQMGFADMLLGWSQILCHQSLPVSTNSLLRNFSYVPDINGLSQLVDALRQLSRIGNASTLKLRSTTCSAWVAAFCQWCVGAAPSVYLENGRSVIEHPTSRITLIVSGDISNCPGLEITILDSLGSPAELISAGDHLQHGSRMVTIERYCQWLLQDIGLDSGISRRATTQALPYCLRQVVRFLRVSKIEEFHRSEASRRWQTEGDPNPRLIKERGLLEMVPCPFPKDSVISDVLSRVLEISQTNELPSLKEGLLITDLPLVQVYINDLKKDCKCTPCSYSDGSSKCEGNHGNGFIRSISILVADVLALSLFEFPEALLVYLSGLRVEVTSFYRSVSSILEQGQSESSVCPIGQILLHALTLVGHAPQDLGKGFSIREWVITSFKGQVVYPKIFQTQYIQKRGYLILSWAPGLLQYDGENYSRGVSDTLVTLKLDTLSSQGSGPVNVSRNLVPDQRLVWQVSRDDDFLRINMGIQETTKEWRHISKTPFRVLLNLAYSFFLETCPHPSDSALVKPNIQLKYTGPLNPHSSGDASLSSNEIGVAAVEGNDGLRMLCLTWMYPAPFVIRGGACLACCVDVCQRTGYDTIIC